MRRAPATLAAALLGLVALGGCGGSGSSSTAASSSTTAPDSTTTASSTLATTHASSGGDAATTLLIESICESFQTKVRNVKPPSFNPQDTTVKQLPLVATYLGKVVALNQTEVQQFAAAAKQAHQPARYKAFVEGFQQLTRLEGNAQQQAKRGDLTNFKSGLTGAATAEQLEAQRAKTLGLKAC